MQHTAGIPGSKLTMLHPVRNPTLFHNAVLPSLYTVHLLVTEEVVSLKTELQCGGGILALFTVSIND